MQALGQLGYQGMGAAQVTQERERIGAFFQSCQGEGLPAIGANENWECYVVYRLIPSMGLADKRWFDPVLDWLSDNPAKYPGLLLLAGGLLHIWI